MRDWSLPGYKYLGPGNKLDKGKPNNRNDRVAFKHDLAYDKYIKEGKNPYINFNDADEEALVEFGLEDYGGAMGKAFFKAKRFAWQAGLINNLDKKRSKRLRGSQDVPSPGLKSSNDTQTPPPTMATSRGPDGAGSGNEAGLKETPVDEVMNVHRGPPDYTFASLPFISMKKYFTSRSLSTDLSYRMTSVYDPEISIAPITIGGSNTQQPQDTEPDAQILSARWFNYYSSLYKFYHVVACRYSVYVENLSGEPLWVHLMHYNDELPPPGASNEDHLLWKDCRTQYLTPQYRAVVNTGSISTAESDGAPGTDNPNAKIDEDNAGSFNISNYQTGNHVSNTLGHSSCNFSGTYRPGDFRREIILDAQVENWTSINTNPALSERLLIRLKPENPAHDATQLGGDTIHAKVIVKLEYLVEFKELVSGLRWPVQRQPLAVTVTKNEYTSTA